MESIKDIRKLLDRFYQGETSMEEEQLLQDYFSSPGIPNIYSTPSASSAFTKRSDAFIITSQMGVFSLATRVAGT